MTNHFAENMQNFLIVEKSDFVKNLTQALNLFDFVISLNIKIDYHKKILIVVVKQNKYDFDIMNIDSSDIDKT